MIKNEIIIDRITVVGEVEASLQELSEFLGNHWDLKNGAFEFNRIDDDDNLEHVAWLEENKFNRNHWRLDYNPNHINEFEQGEIQKVINFLNDVHFSRLDVAFDIYNEPLAMKYEVYKFNTSETIIETTYLGRAKKLETHYWGSRKSGQQIRLYDKLVEQKAKKHAIPDDIKDWARLELQLRGDKPKDWINSVQIMLDQYKLANLKKINNVNDRVMINGLITHVADWNELSKDKQARLRKMIKNGIGFDNDLALDLVGLFAENVEKIENDLLNLLDGVGVLK